MIILSLIIKTKLRVQILSSENKKSGTDNVELVWYFLEGFKLSRNMERNVSSWERLREGFKQNDEC